MHELLLSMKLKGRATPEELAAATGDTPEALGSTLSELADRGLVVERATGRRPGWMLTPQGRAELEALQEASTEGADLDALAQHYEGFLALNSRVKGLCTQWQGTDDDAARFDMLEDLREAHEGAARALAGAGEVIPRFGRYGERLGVALDRAEDDPRFVVSSAVDSYHAVWFEAHEDFLSCLGRTREEEGSA